MNPLLKGETREAKEYDLVESLAMATRLAGMLLDSQLFDRGLVGCQEPKADLDYMSHR